MQRGISKVLFISQVLHLAVWLLYNLEFRGYNILSHLFHLQHMVLNFSWCELKLLTRDTYGKRSVIELEEVSSAKDTPGPTGALVIQSSMLIQHFSCTLKTFFQVTGMHQEIRNVFNGSRKKYCFVMGWHTRHPNRLQGVGKRWSRSRHQDSCLAAALVPNPSQQNQTRVAIV